MKLFLFLTFSVKALFHIQIKINVTVLKVIIFEMSQKIYIYIYLLNFLYFIYFNFYFNLAISIDTLYFLDVTVNRVFGPLTKVILSKDGSGLGFSLDGGKNSPTGDQPLTVKKIFTGK